MEGSTISFVLYWITVSNPHPSRFIAEAMSFVNGEITQEKILRAIYSESSFNLKGLQLGTFNDKQDPLLFSLSLRPFNPAPYLW